MKEIAWICCGNTTISAFGSFMASCNFVIIQVAHVSLKDNYCKEGAERLTRRPTTHGDYTKTNFGGPYIR